MKRKDVEAFLQLAGMVNDYSEIFEIKNEYCDCCDPWWLVKTKWGLIKMGWRKRVADIDWSDTPYRAGETLFWDGRHIDSEYIEHKFTKHEVTQGPTNVHAGSYGTVVTYLSHLRLQLVRTVINKPEYRHMWEADGEDHYQRMLKDKK